MWFDNKHDNQKKNVVMRGWEISVINEFTCRQEYNILIGCPGMFFFKQKGGCGELFGLFFSNFFLDMGRNCASGANKIMIILLNHVFVTFLRSNGPPLLRSTTRAGVFHDPTT